MHNATIHTHVPSSHTPLRTRLFRKQLQTPHRTRKDNDLSAPSPLGTYVRGSQASVAHGVVLQSSAAAGCTLPWQLVASGATEPSTRDTQATERERTPVPHGALQSDQTPT